MSAPPVFLNASSCSKLVPERWYKQQVLSANLPVGPSTGGWITFGVQQTGQLDKANQIPPDIMEIITKCEARDAEAAKALKKPWYQFW